MRPLNRQVLSFRASRQFTPAPAGTMDALPQEDSTPSHAGLIGMFGCGAGDSTLQHIVEFPDLPSPPTGCGTERNESSQQIKCTFQKLCSGASHRQIRHTSCPELRRQKTRELPLSHPAGFEVLGLSHRLISSLAFCQALQPARSLIPS